MRRLPTKAELLELLVEGFEPLGVTLTPAQRTELAEIVSRESAGILRWIIAGMTPERRANYLRRIREVASRN